MDLRNRLQCVTIHSVSDGLGRLVTANERIRLICVKLLFSKKKSAY